MAKGETFAYLTFPKIPPEKYVGDYLKSKLEIDCLRKYREWDIPRTDPIMNLVSARKDLRKAQLQLIEKKEDAKELRRTYDLQWDELREDAEKLKKTFCEFDKMIIENGQKRERAIVKKQKQKQLQIERDKAIKELQIEYDKLFKIKEKMEYQIKNHKMYEDFLQRVAESHPEYQSAQDVFNKFGALDEARNALTERFDEYLMALENTKSEMIQVNLTQSSILIGVNNRIAELHNRYATAKREVLKWEEMVRHVQLQCRHKLLEIMRVRRACRDIYLDMCRRKKIEPQFEESDFENQLFFIKSTMSKLKKTLELAKEKSAKEMSSVQVETSRSKRRI